MSSRYLLYLQTLAICIANSICEKLTEIRKKRVKNGGRKGPFWKRRAEAALGTICKIYASLLNLDIIELNQQRKDGKRETGATIPERRRIYGDTLLRKIKKNEEQKQDQITLQFQIEGKGEIDGEAGKFWPK